MDRDELLERIRGAREKGATTPQALRLEVLDGIATEVKAEQAGTLARLGRRLERAVAALRALEARYAEPDADRPAIRELHAAARAELAEARWECQVVREAMGLRRVREDLDRHWPMPPPLGF